MAEPHSDTTPNPSAPNPSAGPSRESAGPSPAAEPASFRPAGEQDGTAPEAKPAPGEGKIEFTHEGGDMAAASELTPRTASTPARVTGCLYAMIASDSNAAPLSCRASSPR